MGLFRRRVPNHFILVHQDNAASKDWVIMLEAGTIVGPSPSKLRVARATQERSIVRKFDILLNTKHYLVMEGFNPRIHVMYFCPQLYRYDSDRKLVPLQGEEIGALIAQAIESGVSDRRPWYQPAEQMPNKPVISTSPLTEFDTVVVEMASGRNTAAG